MSMFYTRLRIALWNAISSNEETPHGSAALASYWLRAGYRWLGFDAELTCLIENDRLSRVVQDPTLQIPAHRP
jgi:hypothetical protein